MTEFSQCKLDMMDKPIISFILIGYGMVCNYRNILFVFYDWHQKYIWPNIVMIQFQSNVLHFIQTICFTDANLFYIISRLVVLVSENVEEIVSSLINKVLGTMLQVSKMCTHLQLIIICIINHAVVNICFSNFFPLSLLLSYIYIYLFPQNTSPNCIS